MVNLREQRTELPIAPTEEDCQGRTYIVTGANTGLGFECAQHLVRLRAERVILACRSLARGEAAKKRIEENTGRSIHSIEVWQLELGSYDSVKAFAARAQTLDRIDAVVENASVAMLEYEVAEGLESSLTINVAGTFLLAFLLPKLRQVAQTFETKPNLVFVGSEVAFGMKGQLEKVDGDRFDSLTESAKASKANRYQTTKLLQCYAVRELAKIESQAGSDIIVNIVNPGLCKTELARRAGPLLTVIFNIFKFLVARTSEMGSRTLLHAAFAGPESHGRYLAACQVQEHVVPGWVTDNAGQATQKRVWASLTGKLE